MGRDKAALPAGDGTLIEHLARRLAPVVDETIVAGGSNRATLPGVRMVEDRYPGLGPLAGMHAGLLAPRQHAARRQQRPLCDARGAARRRSRAALVPQHQHARRLRGLAQDTTGFAINASSWRASSFGSVVGAWHTKPSQR